MNIDNLIDHQIEEIQKKIIELSNGFSPKLELTRILILIVKVDKQDN